MSVPEPDRDQTRQPPAAPPVHESIKPTEPAEAADAPVATGDRSVPRTRWGAAWIGVCAAALASVALIVFMVQNTSPVEISFLWMHGTLPLALALLIAAVGSTIVAMVFGIARITQLRKLARHRH